MRRLFVLLSVLLAAHALPAGAQAAWQRPDAEELLRIVEGIGADGLDPADYEPTTLRRELAGGQAQTWSMRATTIFLHLARDLGNGHLRDRRRVAWHIPGQGLDEAGAQRLLADALAANTVGPTLSGLSPKHDQYRRLKEALAATPAKDKASIERLRANLERWRWMPRELGKRYLLVNVPAFTVSLVQDGVVVERRRVVVGKRATPTPQFAAQVSGIIVNPWWDVPASIVRESVGQLMRARPGEARARGYTAARGRIRQVPGPGNALGQVKLVMPNPFTVYLHDTPSKQLFGEDVRAFSHGCIRVQDALGLASSLLAGTQGWNRARIDTVVASGVTTQVPLSSSLPVYVAYFTAAADDAGEIATFPDIYGRDGPVVASLVDRQIDTQP